MRFHPILPAVFLLAAFAADAAAPASTPVDKADCLVLRDGWIRLPPSPRPMLAGFGRIANGCSEEQVVVAVHSPRFGDVSLHETQLVDGVSRMRGLDRLPVAAGGEAVLQPGGMHLMLMQPDAVLAEGERVPLVLVLEDGREVTTGLQVRKDAPAP